MLFRSECSITVMKDMRVSGLLSADPITIKLIKLLSDANKTLEIRAMKGLKLARLVKNKFVWGVLAGFCLENRDTSTAEVALAALDLLAVGHAPRPGGPADREIARAIEHAIAFGGEADDRHFTARVTRQQQRLDMHRLPHRKPAFARGNHQPARLAGCPRCSTHQVTRFFTVDHWRRLTGKRSVTSRRMTVNSVLSPRLTREIDASMGNSVPSRRTPDTTRSTSPASPRPTC